jgi:phosphate transport system substrate-binding protein
VAAGFLAFVASAPGQKILLNAGLVPATMPVRLVQITQE